MKKTLLALSFLLLCLAGFAQGLTMDKVPQATTAAYKSKFPNGSQPGWTKAGADVFEVQFFNGKKRQSALFDANGKWIRTDSEINYGAVPMKVQNAFAREFEGYQIQEVYEVESAENGMCYEITAFKGAKNFLVVFSAKGELLKKDEGE